MDILVGIHTGDYDGGANAAKISLDEAAIKHIFQLARKAKKGQSIAEYDNTPDLGTSDLTLDGVQEPYRDLSKISEEESQQAVFGVPEEEIRTEISQLHVDGTDFWWEGVFKHTDAHWETRMIPLSFLPQPAAVQSGRKPAGDLNMTGEQIQGILEKIARGISHGLNAREIEATFQRHVTKAQLIRVIWELIERK